MSHDTRMPSSLLRWVLRVAGAALATFAVSTAEAQLQSDPDKEALANNNLRPEPAPGGPAEFGDPIQLSDLTPTYSAVDVALADSRGGFSLTRRYMANPYAWLKGRLVAPLPKPFGHSPADPASLHWWHNLYSFVALVPKRTTEDPLPEPDAVVRDTNGALLTFTGALISSPGQEGWLGRDTAEGDAKLYWRKDRFILYAKDGRYVYRSLLATGTMGTSARYYFLTEVEDATYPEGAGGPTKLSLQYSSPGVLSEVVTGDGAWLRFAYGSSGLEKVELQDRNTGRWAPVVRYEYANGMLSAAKYPELPAAGGQVHTLQYEYGTATAPVFGVRVNGRKVMEKQLADDVGRVTYDWTPSQTLEVKPRFPAVLQGDPHCFQWTATGGCASAWQSFLDTNASVGDGHAAGNRSVSLTTSYLTQEGGTTKAERHACSGYCGGFTSGVEREWQWGTVSGTRVNQWYRDTRGGFSIQRHAAAPVVADPSQAPAVERTEELLGAQDALGTGALRSWRYSYEYGGQGQSPVGMEQLLVEVSEASALVPGQVATVTPRHDKSTNRLEAVIRSGYTQTFVNGAFALEQRHLGTFYYVNHECLADASKDAFSRTLEVHGPCWVSSASATGCDLPGPVPVMQYAFYGAAASPANNANKLEETRVFVDTVSAGGRVSCQGKVALTMRVAEYDARGRPVRTVDENGVETSLVYAGERILEKVVAGQATRFEYDEESNRVRATTYPSGQRELSCYRTGADAACRGGAASDELQWKAKVSAAGQRTEWVAYEYRGGQLLAERYLDGNGAVRRVLRYDYEPRGARTYVGAGEAPGVGTITNVDAEGTALGVGHPYNEPPDFCGGHQGFVNKSDRCSRLLYDRARRLTRVEVSPAPGAAPARTCVDYDAQGNVSAVKSGCDGTCGACRTWVSYRTDDFGNVLSVSGSWMGDGSRPESIETSYNALGKVEVRQTPQMRSRGERLVFEYDAKGRSLSTTAVYGSGAAAELLYSQGYDGSEAPPPGCPAVGSSGLRGRVQVVRDSFGETWFAYDALGNVVAKARKRRGVPRCESVNGHETPNSTYAYLPDGRLLRETYPHGRTVTYGYCPSGSGLEDRIKSVQVGLAMPTGEVQSTELLSDIRWEPYAGLRSYVLAAPQAPEGQRHAVVEYLLAADGSARLPEGCQQRRPSQTDGTGRLMGVWVSKLWPQGSNPGEGADTWGASEYGGGWRYGAGDIFKRNFRWKADQFVEEATCVLDDTVPRTQLYASPSGGRGYDQQLRLLEASRPPGESQLRGGAFTQRSYQYDSVGNRVLEQNDDWVFGYAYGAGGLSDRLLSRKAVSAVGGPAPLFEVEREYDLDGRVTRLRWQADSTGLPARALRFDSDVDGAHAAVGAVYRHVQLDESAVYEYFYDAVGRRRLKVYPDGTSDELFHDDTRLLEDRAMLHGDDGVLDEYVWLDGRPVALLKSRFDASGQRQPDFAGTCERRGEQAPCGVYFIVSDYLGKPVLMLDSQRRVTGVADYEPFGHVNRVTALADTTSQTVADPSGTGRRAYSPGAKLLLHSIHQRPGTGREGTLSVRVRARYAMVDTEEYGPQGGDWAYVADLRGKPLETVGAHGHHRGALVGEWAELPPDGEGQVRFEADASPNDLSGVLLEAYEYQRFETGQRPCGPRCASRGSTLIPRRTCLRIGTASTTHPQVSTWVMS